MGKRFNLSVALAGAVALAAPADAAIFIATVTGTVSSGTLFVDAFGLAAGTDVAGLSYTTVYTIDDGLNEPGVVTYTYTPDFSGASGGNGFGDAATPVSATFTLNGQTVSIDGRQGGVVYKTRPSMVSNANVLFDVRQIDVSVAPRRDILVSDTFFDNDEFSSADYRENGDFAANPPSGNSTKGYFFDSLNDGASSTFNVSLTLVAERLVVSGVSPVPEIGTWAMMIGGLGLTGGTLRRRAKIETRWKAIA